MTARLLSLLAAGLALAACSQAPQGTQIVPATPVAPRAPSASQSAQATELRVYVTGAVTRPGVYGLAPESRIEDAITAAGGFVPGADMPRVNLAARVRDEDEIFVPRVGENIPNLTASGTAVNVNTASATQLRDALGISSTLAGRIVAYRRQHGPFKTVEDLRLVPVPDDQLSRIRTQITAR